MLGKIVCVHRLDLLFVQPPPPAEPKRGSVPIGVRGSRFPPTSLARQVGAVAQVSSGMTSPPFALFYGAEAVSPTDLVYGPPRVLAHAELERERLRQDNALLLEGDRIQAA